MITTVQLNTNLIPIFRGTYYGMWEVNESEDENGNQVYAEYEQKNLMQSIVEVYKSNEKYILSELNCSFIKELHFTGDFVSPREYNFRTDELDFDIKISRQELIEDTLEQLRNDENFKAFLHDNYTSYDGFMSFTPNNYQDIYTAIRTESDEYEQALSAIINYFAKDNLVPHGGCSIEEMIYDDWQGNGYYGLDYEILPIDKVE